MKPQFYRRTTEPSSAIDFCVSNFFTSLEVPSRADYVLRQRQSYGAGHSLYKQEGGQYIKFCEASLLERIQMNKTHSDELDVLIVGAGPMATCRTLRKPGFLNDRRNHCRESNTRLSASFWIWAVTNLTGSRNFEP